MAGSLPRGPSAGRIVTLIRRSPVGISVEQLASAWARQEDAQEGSTVVVAHEISGRMRLGIPWQIRPANALSCATVLRPRVRPDAEAVLWVAALVAATSATGARPGWPDLLFADDGRQIGAVNLDVHLGPGTIVSAVVSLRVDLVALGLAAADGADSVPGRDAIVETFTAHALRCSALAEDQRAELLHEYAEMSCVVGRPVRAKLLPRGETRGTVVAVDPLGLLVLESPTGMLERLSPVTVLRLDPIP